MPHVEKLIFWATVISLRFAKAKPRPGHFVAHPAECGDSFDDDGADQD
jgi:hypothetical protein